MRGILLAVSLSLISLVAGAAEKRIAIFVQNRTQTAGMDVACGAIRERLMSGLAEVEGLSIVDSTMATDAFNASPNVARQLGVDYVVVVGVVGASMTKREVNARASTVFTLRMTTRVTDAAGATVSGMPMWMRQLPVLDAQGDVMSYYDILIDQWTQEAVAALAQQSLKWRLPLVDARAVAFRVSTTVDRPIAALESQTKGVSGERLAELRKVVGGATIELDGVAVGTAPCELRTNPGLHKLRVTRQWMAPYEATLSVPAEGGAIEVALELNAEGVAKWGSIEKVQSEAAFRYGEAAKERGIKINIDTGKWRDGALNSPNRAIKISE